MSELRPLQGSLERSLSALLIDAPEAHAELEAELRALRGGEMSQMVQIGAQGVAASTPVFTEQAVTFPHPFVGHIDPTVSDTGLEFPQFASGVELHSGGFVLVDAQLRDWVRSEQDWIVGARVRISAWAPSATKRLRYSAVVHLTFTGYATPSDDESEA